MKTVLILPAYNAERSLVTFLQTIPNGEFDEIILVDDMSVDDTYVLAKKQRGIHVYKNSRNLGYGGNLKRCIDLALKGGADIVVELHPDGEYGTDGIAPALASVEGGAALVLGNRFANAQSAGKTGMWWWKYPVTKLLTWVCNRALGTKIHDLHQGFRVYTKDFLRAVPYHTFADDFLFSFEIIAWAVRHGFRVAEVPVSTRYMGIKRGVTVSHAFRYTAEVLVILLGRVVTRIVVALLAIAGAFLLSVLLDRVLGNYLNKHGYFKALPPNVKIVYDTLEFSGVATISAQGIRNKFIESPKPKGTYRILAIGDSYTYGWGVQPENSWVKLVQNELRKQGKKVDIIDAGIPGAGPTDERYSCQAYRDQFDVDGIIWGVYTDDWYQAVMRDDLVPRWWQLILDTWRTFPRLNRPIINEPNLKSVPAGMVFVTSTGWKKDIADILKNNPTILLHINPDIRSAVLEGKINPGMITRGAEDPNVLMFMLSDDGRNMALKSFEIRIRKFISRCAGSLPSLIVYMPGPTSVSTSYYAGAEALGYKTDPALTTYSISTYVRPIVEKYHIPFISLTPSFRTDGCPGCYYPYDAHMTAVGNRRAAEIILPFVEKTFFR